MKKTCIKIMLLVVLFELLASTLVMGSSSSFRISLQSGNSVKQGEIIEIPIILDNVTFDGIQKGIIAFSGKIGFDENSFEMVPYEDNKYIKVSEELTNKEIGYTYLDIEFNIESKKFAMNLNVSYFNEVGGYLDGYTKIGTIKLKAKENIQPGEYGLSITEVTGGNNEMTVNVSSSLSTVNVIGELVVENDNPENEEILGETKELIIGGKTVKIKILQNKEGTELIIVPDEVDGVEIGKVVIGEDELKEENGKYAYSVKPGQKYTINFYGINGDFLASKDVTTSVYNETNDDNLDDEVNGDNNVGDNTQDKDDTNKDDGNKDDGNKDDGNKDDTNKDEQKPTDNKKPDQSKPVQTGDSVYLTIGVLTIALIIIIASFAYTYMKENGEI